MHSESSAATIDSCNLYPAICLQVQGDAIKCNFGAKPFIFDLDAFLQRLRRDEQLSKVKSKQVSLKAVYAIVKDYLQKNAYTETLSAIETEYVGFNEFGLVPEEQEETKDSGLAMHRKMTLDFGDQV